MKGRYQMYDYQWYRSLFAIQPYDFFNLMMALALIGAVAFALLYCLARKRYNKSIRHSLIEGTLGLIPFASSFAIVPTLDYVEYGYCQATSAGTPF